MRKVLHILKILFLLAWLVFVILCCHSCLMGVSNGASGSEGPAAGEAPVSQSAAVPPAGENEVALSSGNYPKDTETLTAVITPADLTQLDSFPALRSADFSGSSCYAEIVSWAKQHPEVQVTYTVALPGGQVLPSSAETVDLSGMNTADADEAARLLSFLPNVKTVDLGTAQAGSVLGTEELAAFAAACPNAELKYSLSFLGQELALNQSELDFSSLTSGQVNEAASVLRCMNQVSKIRLSDSLNLDDVALLHEAAPDAVLDYNFSLWGVDANLADETLSFSHIKMNDEGEAVRRIVPCMKNLKTLDMDSCDVSNEAMAVIRDENPDVKVIWRVWFGGYTARTDVERILASSVARGGVLTDDAVSVLKYCTKVKYLDLGHNKAITDISFVSCMPDLEVAIFAINDIEDISALADCPKLEYLEINSTNVTDLTPLSNLSALRYLNIGRCQASPENDGTDEKRPRVTDISPLFGLTDLQRLFIGNLTAPGIPKEQLDKMAEVMGVQKVDSEGDYCDPKVSPEGLAYDYCRINISSGDPSQGSWRTAGYRPDWVWAQAMANGGVFNDPLNERYKLLREQFGYDTADQSYSLPQNDPLY